MNSLKRALIACLLVVALLAAMVGGIGILKAPQNIGSVHGATVAWYCPAPPVDC